MPDEYDVIVVGGGPGGSSTSSFLARKGYNVLLLDKQHFPRDKICGDGVGGKSVRILEELGLIEEIERNEHADMYGVIFTSPRGDWVEIETKFPDRENKPAGYVVRRYVLDNILFQAAKRHKNVEAKEGHTVIDVLKDDKGRVIGVKAKDENEEVSEFKANVVVGADGASSVVATKVGAERIEPEHHVVAVRTYYENVKGMKDKIEIHFIDEVLPGYFWIFPLPNGRANVGVGMLTSDMRKKKVDLKEALERAINSPRFKERFEDARPLEPVKGWGLPLGSKRRKGYGDGYVLVGDAAALIDPFTGEGIGNALLSGKLASEAIDMAFQKKDFSASTLSYYDQLLREHLDDELQTMYRLQRLGRIKFLLNLILGKAAKNEKVRNAIAMTLVEGENNVEAKKRLASPLFWVWTLLS